MSTVQIIGAAVGILVIALTIWQIAKHGIAKDNGNLPDENWPSGA